jgi:hypothetical protein
MTKIDDRLKHAILMMHPAEKDKLLLKLIAKDYTLVEKLQYQLLENSHYDLEKRRATIIEDIEDMVEYRHDTPGLLMMSMRAINGDISRHVKTTSDKIGEVLLTLTLVNKVFANERNYKLIHSRNADTFFEYVAKKIEFILAKVVKLNKDDAEEFVNDINLLLNYMHNSSVGKLYAKDYKIPTKFSL